jgi:hypothetical protein
MGDRSVNPADQQASPQLPALCPSCGYAIDQASPNLVCPECGKDPRRVLQRLVERSSLSYAWLAVAGAAYIFVAGAAAVVGRELDIGGFILAGIGVGLVIGACWMIRVVRRDSGGDVRPYYASLIGWNRAAASLGLPLLVGHCGTMLYAALFIRCGGVIQPYWTAETEAQQIISWMQRGVSVTSVVAAVWGVWALWTALRLCVGGSKWRVLLLVFPFMFLLALSAIGGWGILESAEMRDMNG